MQKYLFFLSIIYLSSCNQYKTESTKSVITDSSVSTIDTSRIAILPFDTIQSILSLSEVKRIDSILVKCINNYNPKKEKQYHELLLENPTTTVNPNHFIIDLKRYKRQYIVMSNTKEGKEVWINCFCYSMESNWKKEIISVKDGGNCFFNLKVDLTTGKYYDFMVNGNA